MTLKLAWSNWKDSRAVKRAEKAQRKRERAEGNTIVVRAPIGIVAILNATWIATKIGIAVLGAFWAYQSVPGMGWIGGKLLKGSILGDIADIATSTKDKAGSATAAAGRVAGDAFSAIGSKASAMWAGLPSWKSAPPYRGDWNVHSAPSAPASVPAPRAEPAEAPIRFAALPPAPAAPVLTPTAPPANPVPQVKSLPSLALPTVPATPRQVPKVAALPSAPLSKEPSPRMQIRSYALEGMTPDQRQNLHWRGVRVPADLAGWEMAPCGKHLEARWALVRSSDRANSEPGCPLRPRRYVANELPPVDGGQNVVPSADPGHVWRQRWIGQRWAWILEPEAGYKGPPATRSMMPRREARAPVGPADADEELY